MRVVEGKGTHKVESIERTVSTERKEERKKKGGERGRRRNKKRERRRRGQLFRKSQKSRVRGRQ
jgi:hypothetical protein